MSPIWPTISIVAATLALTGRASVAQDDQHRVRPDGLRTISVQGSASASLTPDIAGIVVGAETRGPTATEALAANNKAMAALMDVLKRRGVAARDIKTSAITLSPAFDRPVKDKDRAEDGPDKPPPRIVGYEIKNTIQIIVRDVARVGDLLDATVKAGVNKIERLSFSIADPLPTLRELRKKALADAKAKAEDVAKEAGMTLGLPLSIDVDYSPPQYSFTARSIGSDKYDSTVPIAAGVEELDVAVAVVYEMKPPR